MKSQIAHLLDAMDVERFWVKVDRTGDCWIWRAGTKRKGYGQMAVRNPYGSVNFSIAAHRIAYELCRGPIPEGAHVLHRCDNPPCVNPDHLFVGTAADNMRDKMAKGRWRGGAPKHTHCRKGHEFTPDNKYRNGKSYRCRTCQIERMRSRRPGRPIGTSLTLRQRNPA